MSPLHNYICCSIPHTLPDDMITWRATKMWAVVGHGNNMKNFNIPQFPSHPPSWVMARRAMLLAVCCPADTTVSREAE